MALTDFKTMSAYMRATERWRSLHIIGGARAYARQWVLEGPRAELPLPSIGGYMGHWQLEGPGKP